MTKEEIKELKEALHEANTKINTTPIKGKDYAEVNQRVKAFREVYPNGRIETFIDKEQSTEKIIVIKAIVYDGEDHMLATGTAREKDGDGFINKTSHVENCETSAIGRALGFAGFGIDTSIASVEEVKNAQLQQEKKADDVKNAEMTNKANNSLVSDANINVIKKKIEEAQISEIIFLQICKVKSFKEMKFKTWKNCMDNWSKCVEAVRKQMEEDDKADTQQTLNWTY